jgi:cytochrome c
LKTTLILALLGCLMTAPALASQQLAQKNACVACHAADRKLVGPSYADVAKKYGTQASAVAQLTESIRKGGVGKWGPIPMPAQPNLSEDDAKALAQWVLRGGK